MSSLIFFNKEGDSINARYNELYNRYETDLLFHQNSSDTFKTIGLYMFEKIPSFTYKNDDLYLKKFQLFNEHGIGFYGSRFVNQQVEKIETINNDKKYFAKWIYGNSFDSKFVKNTKIIFNQEIADFKSNKLYTVLQTKKNAILVISITDNNKFNDLYSQLDYTNINISSINVIGVKNYVNEQLTNNLSEWNEYDFYNRLSNNRKLNVNNSLNNDGIYTIKNSTYIDSIYNKYTNNIYNLTSILTVKVNMLVDAPIIYQGNIEIKNNKILFDTSIPNELRPENKITIPLSLLNNNILTVSKINFFNSSKIFKKYFINDQVIWNNKIYQCYKEYDWSNENNITPDNSEYWNAPNYLNIDEMIIDEDLFNVDLLLTTNQFEYSVEFNNSLDNTFDIFNSLYADKLSYHNLIIEKNERNLSILCNLPDNYIDVKILFDNLDVTSKSIIYEKNIEINENINTTIDYNLTKPNKKQLTITKLNNYGLKVIINGVEYYTKTEKVFYNNLLNDKRTIDKTLRKFITNHITPLSKLGINIKLLQNSSVLYDTILFETDFPNVPLSFNVNVGSNNSFFIPYSKITFNNITSYLNATINGISFNTPYNNSINNTLNDFYESYYETLLEYNILIKVIGNILYFNKLNEDTIITYTFKTGDNIYTNRGFYEVDDLYENNIGTIISSNEIILDNEIDSFEDNNFSTGQIISINNSNMVLDNREYNIIQLEPKSIVLSYKGPFWGNYIKDCFKSAYTIIAFNQGFERNNCVPKPYEPPFDPNKGEFSKVEFNGDFKISSLFNNKYIVEKLFNGSNLTDIIYNTNNNRIYVLSNTNLFIFDDRVQLLNSITLDNIYERIVLNETNNIIYLVSNTGYVIYDNIDLSEHVVLNNIGVYDVRNNGDLILADVEYLYLINKNNTTSINLNNILTFKVNRLENIIIIISGISIYYLNDNNLYSIIGNKPNLRSKTFYDEFNGVVYLFTNTNIIFVKNNIIEEKSLLSFDNNLNISYNNIYDDLIFTYDNNIQRYDLNGDILYTSSIIYNGDTIINQKDGDIYMLSENSNQIIVIDNKTNYIKKTINISSKAIKMIYVDGLQTLIGMNNDNLFTINVTINSIIETYVPEIDNYYDNSYGTLSPDYVPEDKVWVKSREYIRKPRENYNNEPTVKYIFKWETDELKDMFLFDFSGNQLQTNKPNSYIGEKPLSIVSLNRNENKDLSKVNLPQYQQTIFNQLVFDLPRVDSDVDLTSLPEPFEVFIGYKSDVEGYSMNNLNLYKREEVEFNLNITENYNNIINFKYENGKNLIILNDNSNFVFTNNNLKVGQHIKIFINDITNTKNKYISSNNGKVFEIESIFNKYLTLKSLDGVDLIDEFNIIENYPTENKNTYLNIKFKVIDKLLYTFKVIGQTEIEDIRYKIELNNNNQNVNPDDIYIFKDYDINEQGVDWNFINAKRKELLMVRHDIYPYIGTYKSIINIVNFFGYNDLDVYEYYRNFDDTSKDYFKLKKVKISNLFNKQIKGYDVEDNLINNIGNKYEPINSFNLSYNITNDLGENVLNYTLGEVIIKLQGLKKWINNNIIPITHKITDITGETSFVTTNGVKHKSIMMSGIKTHQSYSPTIFSMDRAYISPISNGSSVYTCAISFKVDDVNLSPDYYNVNVKTYKTEKIWEPFTTYNTDDKIIFNNQIYTSYTNNNKLNNPLKYDNSPIWDANYNYVLNDIVFYQNLYYKYVSNINSLLNIVIEPSNDLINWVNITEWVKSDLEVIQNIDEFRTKDYRIFTFTIDTNIDPFISIKVTSDNGYGLIYTDKKNYELRPNTKLNINTDNYPKIDRFVPINI